MANSSSGGDAAVAAGITALGNYAVQAASNRRQFKYQKQAMNLQYDLQKQMYDYQNAYNTPQQQMQRLQAAGLNPRLIYGGGSANTGNAGMMPVPEVPVRQATTPEIPDVFMRRLVVRQMDAQYAATLQNMEVMRTRSELTQMQTGLAALKQLQETTRSKNYASLALSEERIARFTAHKAKQLLYNEQSKGALLDQNYELRKGAITGIELDNQFKRYRNDLAELGIYSSDHPAMRVLIQASQRMGIDLGALLARGAKELKYLLDLGN